ncbi:MAG: efflux RND transporter periplasmic adaptor subunit [SAR86 cluster bacterium]
MSTRLRMQRKLRLLALLTIPVPMVISMMAGADLLPVTATTVHQQSSYTVSRHYAGVLNPLRTSMPGFESGGVVVRVAVEEGDAVKAGDLLIELDSAASRAEYRAVKAEVQSAQASHSAQRARLELSLSSLQRYKDLVVKGHGAVQRLDELQIQSEIDAAQVQVLKTHLQATVAKLVLAGVRLGKLKITAPFDAIIQARQVDEGSIVSPGQAVMTLVERGELELKVGIPDAMVGYLRHDQFYQFNAMDRSVSGRLTAILPVADVVTGTVTAVFRLADAGLYAGTLAELVMSAKVDEPGFWLPLSALSESQRGLWSVFAITSGSAGQTVETRLVEIIHRGDDAVFVRGTLRDGERIVAGGTARIVPGQRVNITSEKPTIGSASASLTRE